MDGWMKDSAYRGDSRPPCLGDDTYYTDRQILPQTHRQTDTHTHTLCVFATARVFSRSPQVRRGCGTGPTGECVWRSTSTQTQTHRDTHTGTHTINQPTGQPPHTHRDTHTINQSVKLTGCVEDAGRGHGDVTVDLGRDAG